MSDSNFAIGDIVRVKATGKFGRVAEVQDSPDKIRIEYDETWQGYFKPEELEHCYRTTKPDFQTDEDDLKEIDSLLASKKECAPRPGAIFEAFGATYQAIDMSPDDSCYECAFGGEHCELNVDIPSCREGVVFKRVDGAELMVVGSDGKDVGRVERFVDNKFYIQGKPSSFSLLYFIGEGYKLEARVNLAEG